MEAFQASQPYVEYVPGQQNVQTTKIRELDELKREPVPSNQPPTTQIKTLNFMDRSLNDRDGTLVMNPITPTLNSFNAGTLYTNNLINQLGGLKTPIEE